MQNPLHGLDLEDNSLGPLTTLCPVRLGLSDGRVIDAELFLLSDATRPGGVMSVEGTLDLERDFLPVRIGERSVLVGRNAVRFAEIEPDSPGAGGILEMGGSFDVVNLRFDSGETVSGILRFSAPADSMRMSDAFNRPGRFLILTTGDRLILVAKAHLVEASF